MGAENPGSEQQGRMTFTPPEVEMQSEHQGVANPGAMQAAQERGAWWASTEAPTPPTQAQLEGRQKAKEVSDAYAKAMGITSDGRAPDGRGPSGQFREQ